MQASNALRGERKVDARGPWLGPGSTPAAKEKRQ